MFNGVNPNRNPNTRVVYPVVMPNQGANGQSLAGRVSSVPAGPSYTPPREAIGSRPLAPVPGRPVPIPMGGAFFVTLPSQEMPEALLHQMHTMTQLQQQNLTPEIQQQLALQNLRMQQEQQKHLEDMQRRGFQGNSQLPLSQQAQQPLSQQSQQRGKVTTLADFERK